MIINGAGGCFESRVYEIDADSAMRMAHLTINEMGVIMDEIDEANRLFKFNNKKKYMQVCIRPLDEETVEVIMDSTKEHLEIYSWRPENKEVNLFFEIFDKKLREFRAFILCPQCASKISSLVKFCPECGYPIK